MLGKIFNGIVTIVLGAMVAMVFTNAFLRYAFNSGIPAAEELSRYLFVWVCALGTILAYKKGKHIGVDCLTSALHGTPRRIVLLTGQFLILVTFLMVLWGGWEYFLTSAASPGPATEIPFGFVSSSIIVIAVSIIVMTAGNCIRLLREEPPLKPSEH